MYSTAVLNSKIFYYPPYINCLGKFYNKTKYGIHNKTKNKIVKIQRLFCASICFLRKHFDSIDS